MSIKSNPPDSLRLISREHLALWLDQIAEQMLLIAPRDIDGFVLYRKANSAADVIWDYTRPAMPIKDALFPPTERLFTIEKRGQEVRIIEVDPPQEQVLFGVRPCDAHGLQALDSLFLVTDPTDPYYAQRREKSILIGLACKEMGPSCFCTSMGSAPDDPRYLDVSLEEVVGGYLVQTVTEKGAALLERIPMITTPFSGGRVGKDWSKSQTILDYPPLDIWRESFNDPYWDAVGEICLSCRACAYVCPTCRCFDVRDEPLANQAETQFYERIRCWDSCAGEAYRRIAGGHNPRPEKGQRLKNRFYCKFYYFPLEYGPAACTGCGRCIDVCPAGVDITEVLQHMAGKIPVEIA